MSTTKDNENGSKTMKAAKLTTQKVVGILKAAGFESYIRTRRVHRPGFGVRKLSRFVVGVLDNGTDLDGCGHALAEAGLHVTRINEGALKVADVGGWVSSIEPAPVCREFAAETN